MKKSFIGFSSSYMKILAGDCVLKFGLDLQLTRADCKRVITWETEWNTSIGKSQLSLLSKKTIEIGACSGKEKSRC